MKCRLALLFALASWTSAVADTAVLTPSKDNTIYFTSDNLSNGSGQHLFAGTSGIAQRQRALLAFAVADSTASDATVTSVRPTLNMPRTSSNAHTIALHRVLANWSEGTSAATGAGSGEGNGGAPSSSDATWAHTFFDTATWSTPGGDFAADTSAVLTVDAVGAYSWESTPQLVADVQTWLDDPASNFGWILIGNETTSGTSKRFDSRQHEDPTAHPFLTVEFDADDTPALVGDFDADGNVGFQDFFVFADHFGTNAN